MPSWGSIAERIAAVLSPVTLLTGLAIWYGYELAQTRARYFGLHVSVLNYSTTDYLLRAAPAILAPALTLLLIAFVLGLAHSGVRWLLARRALRTTPLRAVGSTLILVGVALGIGGIRAVVDPRVLAEYQVARSLLLASGVLLCTYGIWILRHTLAPKASASRLSVRSVQGSTIAIVLLCVFWAFSILAERSGLESSYQLAAGHLRALPGVVIYSTRPLGLSGPAVQETILADHHTTYAWRYSGLRLLTRSSGNYFLLPAGWASAKDSSIVIPDSPDLRFEFLEPEDLA
jgi:hypothetical protein